VYEHLRSMAGNQLRGERRDHTLSATALVNEAYLRIASDSARSLRAVLRFLRLSGTNAQRNAP
jgi:hypothetical protein